MRHRRPRRVQPTTVDIAAIWWHLSVDQRRGVALVAHARGLTVYELVVERFGVVASALFGERKSGIGTVGLDTAGSGSTSATRGG